MNLPTKHQIAVSPVAVKTNEIIDFLEYFIRNAERCCSCNGCPRHPKEKTLVQKLQEFRQKHGQGSGKEYWEGLERIAKEHYDNLK